MNVLLIDNGTRYKDKLVSLLAEYTVQVVPYDQFSQDMAGAFDILILSGGHLLEVMGHEGEYAEQLKAIRDFQGGVIGICLGFELIVRAFGGMLEPLAAQEKGMISLEILKTQDPLFGGLLDLSVYENHRWAVKTLPQELEGLARSSDGFEIIRHISRPMVGVQFHPEMFVDEACGDEIFRNAMIDFATTI